LFKKIVESGYRGPVGVDLIKTEGNELKLVEINARLTMGRIAYEWNKLLNHYEVGVFVNLFLKNDSISNTADLFHQCLELGEKTNCSISIVNLVHSNRKKIVLVSALIGAQSAKQAETVLLKLKPDLLHKVNL
jgi:hypothetical protein